MKRFGLVGAVVLLVCQGDQRSVRVVRPPDPASFNPGSTAAVFVGVREFDDASLQPVPYAADDAVDLAYAFSQQQIDLVPPSRVVLALSGAPVKEASRIKLTQLLGAGARLVKATQAEVSRLLEQQAAQAGPNGLLIVSFASHGFSNAGTTYVLASNSRFGDPAASLSTSWLLDVAARAGRSLVFLDACRDRVSIDHRAPDSRPSRASLVQARKSVHGQVVLFAAAAGQNAYDNRHRRNGVFTAVVLDGLSCKAAPDANGFVTVDTLAAYVEKHVRSWINRNRSLKVKVATQRSVDGDAGAMPLASCGVPPPAPVCHPKEADVAGRILKTSCWSRTLDGLITQAAVDDLNDDDVNEVIAAVGDTIHVFNAAGHPLWSRSTKAPIRKFALGTRQIVALSRSHLTVIDGNGASRDCSPAGMLHDLVVDRATSHHARRVIVAGIHEDLSSTLNVRGPVVMLAMIDPKKCTALWRGAILPPSQFIEKLETRDVDNDSQRDITLITSAGRLTLNFDGELVTMDKINFVPIHKSRLSVSSNQ